MPPAEFWYGFLITFGIYLVIFAVALHWIRR